MFLYVLVCMDMYMCVMYSHVYCYTKNIESEWNSVMVDNKARMLLRLTLSMSQVKQCSSLRH